MIIRCMLFIYLCLCCCMCHAASNEFDQHLQEQIKQFQEKQVLPAIVVQVYKKEKLYQYFSGYADIASKKPVNTDTIFKIGDLSELITALLFARQIDMGRLQLDHKVSQYLEHTSGAFEHISLQDLATQTSGLPTITDRGLQSNQDVSQFLQDWKKNRSDKQVSVNSALNMEILARVVTARRKNWLSRLYIEGVLNPLGMRPIGIHLPVSFKSKLATGYGQDDKPALLSNDGIFPASKGILASADDMRRFLAASIGLPGTPRNLLYPIRMTQVAYVKLQTHAKGLGWNIYSLDEVSPEDLDWSGDDMEEVTEVPDIPLYKGSYLFEKIGQTDGFSAYMALIPDAQTGIVVLINKNITMEVLQRFARDILLQQNG